MWNPECAITEADAVLAAKNNTITSLRIVKNGADFYVTMNIAWRREELFLSTTRSSKEPRTFKHLGRLVAYIESYFGVKTITLVLDGAIHVSRTDVEC
jgi:hypothetical protein